MPQPPVPVPKAGTVVVKAESPNGVVGVGEGCPREYVTGETIQTATSFFDAHREAWEQFRSLEDLKVWMTANSQRIDMNPVSWCAVELAFLDRWGKEYEQSIISLFKPGGINREVSIFCSARNGECRYF